jgi:Tfp pilus assembly protein FimT
VDRDRTIVLPALRPRNRAAFTTAELLVVLGMMGTLAMVGLPRFDKALKKERTRGALTSVAGHVALARETAVARGCVTTLHLASGPEARLMVTSCKLLGPGVDTVGRVDSVAARLGVELWSSADSLRFGPAGLRLEYETAIVSASRSSTDVLFKLAINPVGRVVWQP